MRDLESNPTPTPVYQLQNIYLYIHSVIDIFHGVEIKRTQ